MYYPAGPIIAALAESPRSFSVTLRQGDSAWNPASMARALWGPAVVTYTQHDDGGITATVGEAPLTRLAVTDSPAVTVERYLPGNYKVVDLGYQRLIYGHDNAGWTLDGYVIPRLASGLHRAIEVTLTDKEA
jgi:hypothetical protein